MDGWRQDRNKLSCLRQGDLMNEGDAVELPLSIGGEGCGPPGKDANRG